MNLEFLSGLLLVIVVLATIVYMAKELFPDLRPRKVVGKGLRDALAQRPNREAKPVNEHLIGTIGEVVANSDDEDRPMKVRLGLELWPARTDSSGESRLPVGTTIEVTAVQEPIVLVRQKTAAAPE